MVVVKDKIWNHTLSYMALFLLKRKSSLLLVNIDEKNINYQHKILSKLFKLGFNNIRT